MVAIVYTVYTNQSKHVLLVHKVGNYLVTFHFRDQSVPASLMMKVFDKVEDFTVDYQSFTESKETFETLKDVASKFENGLISLFQGNPKPESTMLSVKSYRSLGQPPVTPDLSTGKKVLGS